MTFYSKKVADLSAATLVESFTAGINPVADSEELRTRLGGKGAGLAIMCGLGLPVPPGFTINTDVCRYYYANERQTPENLHQQVWAAVEKLEAETGMQFGNAENPLLVSVRSGARNSMPGMLDTVLNLGLNDATTKGLAARSGDERFAYDSYRRFIQMFGNVVLDIDHYRFEEILQWHKDNLGVQLDTDLSAEALQNVVAGYQKLLVNEGKPFPQEPKDQLNAAIQAVLDSWGNSRAVIYRNLHQISADIGTAVTVQSMVFGNRGETSATGVVFTRNPSTGEKKLYGEFLPNAQGEDVVAGIRTPHCLTESEKAAMESEEPSLEASMPAIYAELQETCSTLEQHFQDMQDVEFTVQDGKLWMLQARAGKRTVAAALRIAIEMESEGLIDKATAVTRVDPSSLDQLLHPTLDPKAHRSLVSRGLPASPGAASGTIVFSADDAEAKAKKGIAVILVRDETSPEDIHGMHAAKGILTARGGMTSHAAVVARGMGRSCVAGAGELHIDYVSRAFTVGDKTYRVGHKITIDGSTGEIFDGIVPTIEPQVSGDFAKLMEWADEFRTMKVYTNAETATDAETARSFGAEGIGLCRTEHMFFEENRILAVREMIVAKTPQIREEALDRLLPMQRSDFADLFRIMRGLPVLIRLLDPPLHEFLPPTEKELEQLAQAARIGMGTLRQRVNQLREVNPMLGHRGCRLAISHPEIYQMQARAVFEAQLQVREETGQDVMTQIMIPLVGTNHEMQMMKELVERIAEDVRQETGQEFPYQVGTMIELPRAALRAGAIAEHAEFFSVGSNDLTQTTFGLSRDDSASFLQSYIRQGLMTKDPFVTLDRTGVGEIMEMAIERGRTTRPDLSVGICGEHGGDPDSVEFCHGIGMNYVSCSPYRVPVARLAAAQAAIRSGAVKEERVAA